MGALESAELCQLGVSMSTDQGAPGNRAPEGGPSKVGFGAQTAPRRISPEGVFGSIHREFFV